MTRPIFSLPTWATDEDFASGDETGETSRLEPSSGVKAAGQLPNERMPARYFNWLAGAMADWLGFQQAALDTIKARNWTRENVEFAPSVDYEINGALWVPGQNFTDGGRWYLFGNTGAGTGAILILPAVNPAAPTIATGLENVLTMAIDGDGSVLLIGGTESGGDNTVVKKSTDQGETFTEKVVSVDDNFDLDFLRFEPNNESFVALRNIGMQDADWIWTSADSGETWTDRSGDFPSWIAFIPVVPHVIEAANGTVLIGGAAPTMAYSHDGGVTWALTATLPASVTEIWGLAYSQSRGMWRALGFDGSNCRILKSLDDGVTWTTDAGVISQITDSDQLLRPNALCCDGDALWMIGFTNETGGDDPVNNEQGVVYFGDQVGAKSFVLLHSDFAVASGYKPKTFAFGLDHFGLYGESATGKTVWYTSLKVQG